MLIQSIEDEDRDHKIPDVKIKRTKKKVKWKRLVIKSLREAIRSNRSLFSQSMNSGRDRRRRLRRAFRAIDLNRDGHVSPKEFIRAMERLDIFLTSRQSREILRIADVNRNGT